MDGPDNYELVLNDSLTMGEGTYKVKAVDRSEMNSDLKEKKRLAEAGKAAIDNGNQREGL